MQAAQASETFASGDCPNGVCVVDGYGLRVSVERRHLVVADGLGRHRRHRRFARAIHGLRRLVILGHSGTVSLEALRWLDRVGIYFLHLDTDGKVLASTAQPQLDDSRLRRTQALAAGTPVGLAIVSGLLKAKLSGQGQVAAHHLDAPDTADRIASFRQQLDHVSSLSEVREIEAGAAQTYFAAWTD